MEIYHPQVFPIDRELIFHRFEVHIGIIAACIPALRPGYKWLRQRLHRSRKASSDHLPLADSPAHQKEGVRRKSSITLPPYAYRANEMHSGLLGSDILKTTTIDVEQGVH